MVNDLGQFKIGWIFRDRFANAKSDKTKKENLMKHMKVLSKVVEMNSGEAAPVLGSFYENDGKYPLIMEVVMEFERQEMEEEMLKKGAKTLHFEAYEHNYSVRTNDVAVCFQVYKSASLAFKDRPRAIRLFELAIQ